MPDKSWSEMNLAERAAAAVPDHEKAGVSEEEWLSTQAGTRAPIDLDQTSTSTGSDLAGFLRVIAWLDLAGGVIAAVVIWANMSSGYGEVASALWRTEMLSGVAWAIEGIVGCMVLLAIASILDSVIAIKRATERLEKKISL
jgi:hypothetical protein